MNSAKPLSGRVVLVTGAAGGIGSVMAKAFKGAGARVVIHDVTQSGQAIANELDCTFLQADLSDREDTRKLCRMALKAEGTIDILVNNAGLQSISPIEQFPEDTWSNLIQVMLVAPFQMIKHLAPGMKQKGWGRIINISSIHGLVASPYKSAYVSAKHGLIGLTKTVALELGIHGITVNAICPGYTRTKLTETQIGDQARTRNIPEDEVIDKVMLEPAAIRKLIEPEEIASLAMFLASNDARSITGASYAIDAGWTAR